MTRLFLLFLFALSFTPLIAQDSFQASDHCIANPLLIQQFQGARCLEVQTWTASDSLENRVIISLQNMYSDSIRYPFLFFYSKSNRWYQNESLFLVSKGHFSATYVSLPTHWPGYYHLAILDAQKPSLITVDNTKEKVTIEFRKACALGFYSYSKSPQ